MQFEHIYEAHADSVYAFLKIRLRDSFLIEDIFQETFTAVYRQISDWDDLRSPKAWILTIAHRKMVDRLRRNAHETAVVETDSIWEQQINPDYSHLFVNEMLYALDPLSREILYGVYIEGLTYKEIAGVLGIPEGTAKSRCHYARTKLKERLGGDQDGR
ncbi:RNA polymerase sigma factor [Paenibacillus sp. Soil787]|uniref:RNA polymerase sigma factor n=1 Tax=Paenibacillus sp. Soil787 TaxID=1736411 RepID=UPI000703BA67|nr:sigma-70 family RNA polymerase sigma factor [Paenibacillus sp. Soil787]KRF22537.1 hypothetical protein ASG93_29930 [Paenibacillus sp. Soil787]